MFLCFGEYGQVASELRSFSDVATVSRKEADLTNPESCEAVIHQFNPNAVINAAAYTLVDDAENEEELATVINGHAPAFMARACAQLQIPFVHVSSDFVFDGTGSDGRMPEDRTAPQNAYGRSKENGEKGILAYGSTFAIIRTSWVFSSVGNNFVKTILRLAKKEKSLSVVGDQIGGPTPARDVAKACYQVAKRLIEEPDLSGIYHFSGTPDISWHGFAEEILRLAGENVNLSCIKSEEFKTRARRPLNSRLNCQSFCEKFGIEQPNWEIELNSIVTELRKNGAY